MLFTLASLGEEKKRGAGFLSKESNCDFVPLPSKSKKEIESHRTCAGSLLVPGDPIQTDQEEHRQKESPYLL